MPAHSTLKKDELILSAFSLLVWSTKDGPGLCFGRNCRQEFLQTLNCSKEKSPLVVSLGKWVTSCHTVMTVTVVTAIIALYVGAFLLIFTVEGYLI